MVSIIIIITRSTVKFSAQPESIKRTCYSTYSSCSLTLLAHCFSSLFNSSRKINEKWKMKKGYYSFGWANDLPGPSLIIEKNAQKITSTTTTNGSPNPGQKTRPYNNQQKEENLQNCRLCCPGGPQNKSEGMCKEG